MNLTVRLLAIIALAASFSFTACEKTEDSPEKVYAIGDTGPAGGLVFYDKGSVSDGWRYLEAAPSDTATSAPWGTALTAVPGAASATVGSGKANTDAIIAIFTPATTYAAYKCKSYSLNGHTDWFLPSADELSLMYTNLKANGKGNFIANGVVSYWSSTSLNASVGAKTVYFDDGTKSQNTSVDSGGNKATRAIRAF